jgi:tetratricopeptide (TPR) repeat protein
LENSRFTRFSEDVHRVLKVHTKPKGHGVDSIEEMANRLRGSDYGARGDALLPARGALLLLFLLAASALAKGQVRVWEGTLKLPVYEEGAPDPNPPFDEFATSRFNYPYTLRTEITNQRVEHELRAIYLENEYLKCSVLPDIGGHLYTCLDKISGRPMFYRNPSIKKANIGYRGAWAAFGVEFNFPVSHNWVSMSPVSFAFTTNPDGSASVTVGNIDRVYQMQWSVALTLRPGSTVLEQFVTLSNRSDVRHRFYWWNNAAVEAWDDSRIEYPMRFAAAHGFAEVQTWPVDSHGKDLSIIRNQTDGPVSWFAHGSRENFMGVWHPKTNTGTAHFADYAQLPAKKIWSWGVDADGLDWRTALSDNHSAYVELQAGLFRDQETYAFLEPRQTLSFTEYWMPVRETGGISRANLAGVVHLERKDGTLKAALVTNQKIPSASVRIFAGSTILLDLREDLAPEQVWTRELRLPDVGRKCRFELRNKEGVLLMTQSEGEYDWVPESEIKVGPQTSFAIPPEMEFTADEWLQFGITAELNGELLGAAKAYQMALKKFPASVELEKASGRLLASLRRYREARDYLAAAHARNTTDSETSYYLAISYEGTGAEREAIDAYREAMRLPAYRAAAALRLGELLARQGDLEAAEHALTLGLESAPRDLRTAEELGAVMRARGHVGNADTLAREWLVRFPLSDFLNEEIGQPLLDHLAADPYRVLDVASEYAKLGLYRRAVEVLSRTYRAVPADQREPGGVLPQDHPLVVYFRGYCREKLGESGANDYQEASRLSTTYVFPNSAEDFNSLEAALRKNENDATAHFLLGTWYFARGESDQALGEWSHARASQPRLPVLDASIGLTMLHLKGQSEAAFEVFEEGIKNDPRNVTNYFGAIAAAALIRKSAAERVRILEQYPDPDTMPTALVYELALSRTEAGDYRGAIQLFRNRFFGREEGGTNVRQVWIEVRVAQATGLARAGRCQEALALVKELGSRQAGLAFTENGLEPVLESARTSYRLGELFASCGQDTEANRRYQISSQSKEASEVAWAWAAAKKLPGYDSRQGQERLAAALAEAELRSRTSSFKGWWVYSIGILQMALGREAPAKSTLREALLLPQSLMSYHLARLALDGATPR